MIANLDPHASRPQRLAITSNEALDAAVAEVVRLKIKRTATRAEADEEIARLEKRFQNKLTALDDDIAAGEADVRAYCEAHQAALFAEKKSRETALAVFGFELTPPRVETSSRKITWKDVVARLLRLAWGKAYVRQPEPKPDKEALLTDREKLTPEQQTAAGIQFCQDEQFFIRPKPETAPES
jgi:phage host-nuclease inhibitor protein Gam